MRSTSGRRSAEPLIAEAIDSLHAPTDLAQRAMAIQQGHARARAGHARPLALVCALALVGTLALGGGAYALATSDFVARAFGSHGLGETSTWSVNGGNTSYLYSRSFDVMAADDMDDGLAGAAEDVGLSCTAHGSTLTIESMVLDANGAGAATFTLANPNGFKLLSSDDGELVFDAAEPGLSMVWMRLATETDGYGTGIDQRAYYDVDTSSATELHGTIYFCAEGGAPALGQGVEWGLVGSTDSWDKEAQSWKGAGEEFEASTSAFVPSRLVEARRLADDAGNTASLSPLSIKLALADDADELVVDEISLVMDNGTTRVIKSERGADGISATNYYVSFGWKDGDAQYFAYSLSQLVETDKVSAVTLALRAYGAKDGGAEQRSLTLAAGE